MLLLLRVLATVAVVRNCLMLYALFGLFLRVDLVGGSMWTTLDLLAERKREGERERVWCDEYGVINYALVIYR